MRLTVTVVAVVRAAASSAAVTVTVVAASFSATLAGSTLSSIAVEAVSCTVTVNSAVASL